MVVYWIVFDGEKFLDCLNDIDDNLPWRNFCGAKKAQWVGTFTWGKIVFFYLETYIKWYIYKWSGTHKDVGTLPADLFGVMGHFT